MRNSFMAVVLGLILSGTASPLRAENARFGSLKKDLHLSLERPPQSGHPVIGVVGDSLAVGSSAAIRGGHDASIAPQRIFDTPKSAVFGFQRALMQAGMARIDCEECSFGFLWARSHGLPRENIFFAAQGGARVDSLGEQLDRLALPLAKLPQLILVSYTGNDICSLRNLTPDGRALSQEGRDKGAEVRETLIRELRAGLARNPGAGTRILILGAAPVIELLTNEEVLSHETPVAGKNSAGRGRTCRELRAGVSPLLNQMCPLILNTRPEDSVKLALIRDLHAAVVRGQSEAVTALREEFAGRGVTLEFQDPFREVKFKAGDVSDDCFHPSAQGQRRLFEILKSQE